MLNNWETVAKKISALMAEKMKGLRATGIEPVSHAWEARVLPLNDARFTEGEDTVMKGVCQVKMCKKQKMP